MRVAVLGTGLMGAEMARTLARAGHTVTAWNRTREKALPLEADGIEVAASVPDAVTGADAVLTILFDTESTLALAEDIVASLGADSVWIQSGTVGPDGARRLADAGGGSMLDAPVLGTKKPAAEGNLVVLVSGPRALIEAARPVFDAIGSRTVVAGEQIGQASALKLACNAWIALITAGTAQSLAFAETLGVDPALFLEAIKGAPTDSKYAHLKGNAILAGDYETSFAVDGVTKDVQLMIDAAKNAGFPTDLLEATRHLFARASEQGHGADDMAAVRFAFPD
jgi:3-hydroxyisobutyrate dehydrogenase